MRRLPVRLLQNVALKPRSDRTKVHKNQLILHLQSLILLFPNYNPSSLVLAQVRTEQSNVTVTLNLDLHCVI